jgi:tryptophan synthase alpha chain
LSQRLSAVFAKGHPALLTFVTGGDPTPESTPSSRAVPM